MGTVSRASKKHNADIRVGEDGFVLCSGCDNFASKELSADVGWCACAPCVFGEADSLMDYMDYFKPDEIPKEVFE